MKLSSAIVIVSSIVVSSSLVREAQAELPTLGEIVAQARARGPEATLAQAEIGVAKSYAVGARAASLLNPTLEVFADRGQHTTGSAQVIANLYLPVEIHGQRRKRLDEADAFLAWKGSEVARGGAAAIGEAVDAYGEVLVLAARLREASAGERIAREEARYVEARLAAADATALDVAIARGEVARWVQTRSEVEVALATARGRLAAAIGASTVDTPAATQTADLPALRFADADVLIAHLQMNSPIVAAPKKEAEYFASSRKRWDTEKYAPLTFVLIGGRGDMGEARYGLGLSWTLPLTRTNQGEIARADAESDRALTTASIVGDAMMARARGYFEAYTLARKALAEIDASAIPAAEAVVAAANGAFEAGKADLARVFLARRDLATARERRLALAYDGWHAYANMAALLGGLP
jgi:cobalt-zinc-cadmium efflux system outer membrane protein